ncbi:molybdopterin-dependent oxidoreductase [Paraconexibacter antarcticus]|uniref:Molybdopterin-dependent oxidoreductase n=1 Tax=Paraconexibacter antarcticus TaxID=2949664 RepID=A0ABY5DVK4_9ACTN|nr:molybdopterin cofactor-binding domain-containing protein [Paraconexibacter antarcticus]UTI66038.1 molybdopterin-dependent oxidoreductase [Paraconexibacter antarcticus]
MTDLGNRRPGAAGEADGLVPSEEAPGGISRRRMIGYLLAAPTLVAAARFGADPAEAAVPSLGPTDLADLSDILTAAAAPTFGLLKITVDSAGVAHFALPRAEVGQGITTAVTMVIADEMDLPIDKVKVTLADATPELQFNQLTGGSNTMHALYTPIRTAAATARGQLRATAADELSVPAALLRAADGVFTTPDGRTATYGSLAEKAAVRSTRTVKTQLKSAASLRYVGTEQKRIDARASVTGTKEFAMDLDVPNALPTMVCRPPKINGKALAILNAPDVKAMPGVTDVVIVPHNQFTPGGVAVRAKTFGQCFDAVRALNVKWGGGTVDDKSSASVLADLKKSEIPLTPALPGTTIDETFIFNFRPGDALEPNCAVADVRKDRAEIWSSLKSPIWAKQQIALALGLAPEKVAVHVVEGGGSFGRHLFCDAAFEAASISQKMGKPVRLMWHRTDNFRQGRSHPMAISRVRMTRQGSNVIAVDQRHTGVACDFTQGLGDIFTSLDTSQPGQNFLQFSETVFTFTANVPYQFGAVSQLLNEIYTFNTFNTSSVRNVYSPDVATSTELMVDRVAKDIGKDALQFRLDNAKDDRMKAVMRTVAQAGNWGRTMEAGTAQGIAIHSEYKGRSACLVEIDCRPQTVNRKIREAYTGPRVTKVTYAVDVGLPINILGLKAQIMGGAMDGIAQALTYGLHLEKGSFLEGSWDDAHYTRQWNTPPEVNVIVMPPTTGEPGGAGEFGVGTTMAAVACAYYRATGKFPTEFPINQHEPLTFEPFPTVPPIPASPVDGLGRAGIKRPRKKTTKKKTTHKAG